MNIVDVGYDSTHYYLLDVPGGYLMVDAGWPNTLPKLLNACKRKGVTLTQIKYVLVTHYHPDHAGLVQELKAAGARLILLDRQREVSAPQGKVLKDAHHYVQIELRDNIDLPIDESRGFLQKLGLQGQIVATPGHSDDSVTLVLDAGLAFTGDLGPLLVDGPDDETRRSWERLRALGARTIYPAHGPERKLT